jgi:hypothetical protein
MKLRTELEGRFLRYRERAVDPTQTDEHGITHLSGTAISHVFVDTLAEADGVEFLCPKCFAENKGPIGTHGVICWFVGKVPDHASPKPGRWMPQGTSLDDLTFVNSPGRTSSVLLLGEGCGWHGFVTNGEAA